VRVGTLAMVGGSSGLRQDAPPYMITAGAPPAKVYGINAIGLRRNGFTPETRSLMRRAFGLLYRSGLNFSDAIERIKSELEQTVEIRNLLDFFATSKRGVARGHTRDIVDDDDAV
jgi:UDP-N-acetylglucosamine acyltransferase